MGVNMINNNDILDVMQIKNYTHKPRLFNNVLHNCNFNKPIMRLKYLFIGSYEKNRLVYISFRDNKNIY